MEVKTAAAPVVKSSPPRAHAKVKGTLLQARLGYLAAQGAQAQHRVLHHLTAADRAVVGGTILSGSWYPGDLLLRLEMTIAALLARGDRRQMLADMGRTSAQLNLSPGGSLAAYLSVGDPLFLLKSVPRIYATLHSQGRRTCEVLGPGAAVIRSFDVAEVDADDCCTTVGWLERAIALSGRTAVRVEERQCAALGAPHCEYHCRWD